MSRPIEKSLFIWLDKGVNSTENLYVQQELRSLINHLQTFEEVDQCEKYIHSVSTQDRIVLIISGEFSQQLIPRIHPFLQVYFIYIYCINIECYQQWSEQYVKIKGIFSQFNKLIAQIQDDLVPRLRNSDDETLSFSICDSNINNEQSTSHIDGRFVHSQLLIDCLLRMQSNPTEKNDFISLCLKKYDGNEDLKIIDAFEKTYSANNSIWWYTRETFLYRFLNKSLRVQDIDSLFGLRFLIRDIEQQLQQNHCTSPIRLYRGQLISDEELKIIRQSKGKLISMNSFLSTSRNREMGLFYIPVSDENRDNNLKAVLFEIDADPCQEGVKPFASISLLSYFPTENEVLMMVGSVFLLNDIHLDENQRWIINMTLCSDQDHDLESVVDHMKNQYGTEQTRLLLFGHVLVDMAHFDDAEKYYHRLLKELPFDDPDILDCYHALGKVACEKGDYKSSLEWLQKSLTIIQQKSNNNQSHIGFIYTSIGDVYQKKGCNKQALEFYEKALKIWIKKYGKRHQCVAWCFNNIGNIYVAQKKYTKALNYHKKALEIKEKSLPPQHACLGNGYLNIGNVYYHLDQYDKALSNYQLSKEIYENSLPSGHPSIACALRNIGIIYEVKGEFDKALGNYKKASFIREKYLSTSHPDVVDIQQDIKRLLFKMK